MSTLVISAANLSTLENNLQILTNNIGQLYLTIDKHS